jgi:hypothetical protein
MVSVSGSWDGCVLSNFVDVTVCQVYTVCTFQLTYTVKGEVQIRPVLYSTTIDSLQ